MRRPLLIIAAATIAALPGAPAGAQNASKPKPPVSQPVAQPAPFSPAAPPPQSTAVNVPSKPVGVSPPAQFSDAGVDALRKQIAEAAKKRDRAALAKLVVGKGFFWERGMGDTDSADKKKAGVDNLAV